MNATPILPYADSLASITRFRRAVWLLVYFLFFRHTPSWAFHGYRRAILRTFGAKVGRGCRIHPSCRIWAPWNLVIGDYVALGPGVDCYSVDKIILGSKVCISQRAFICTASHDICKLNRPLTHAPIIVHDHAWVAAEAFIGPGVVLGMGSVVGARAVVVRNVEPWLIVVGNPAKSVGNRSVSDWPEQLQ